MKFAIINDIHFGPSNKGFAKGVQRKLIPESERLVQRFVETMNNSVHPDFVINLGDSIEDVNDRDIDIQSFKHVQSLLSNLTMPTHWLIGNHDIRTLSQSDIAHLLGYKHMYYSFDSGELHFVVLSFEMTGNHTKVMSDITTVVPSEQLQWLKEDLNQTNKPTVVFIHYGLAEDDMKGNFWFEGVPHYALLGNRDEVKTILEESKKVKAVLSAHQHWNKMHVENGIPYIVVTSLVENFKNDGVPAEAYSIVEINDKKIVVTVVGNDPARFEYMY